MRCPFRPDEQQHAIDQRSRARQATVEVRPEVAGTIDSVLSDQRNEPAKGQNCGKTSRIAHENARVEAADFVSWVVVRLDTCHLGNVG